MLPRTASAVPRRVVACPPVSYRRCGAVQHWQRYRGGGSSRRVCRLLLPESCQWLPRSATAVRCRGQGAPAAPVGAPPPVLTVRPNAAFSAAAVAFGCVDGTAAGRAEKRKSSHGVCCGAVGDSLAGGLCSSQRGRFRCRAGAAECRAAAGAPRRRRPRRQEKQVCLDCCKCDKTIPYYHNVMSYWPIVHPFSQKYGTATVAKEFQIGLYDPAEADLKHFWNCCRPTISNLRQFTRK